MVGSGQGAVVFDPHRSIGQVAIVPVLVQFLLFRGAGRFELVHAVNSCLLAVLFGLAESGEYGAPLLGTLLGCLPSERIALRRVLIWNEDGPLRHCIRLATGRVPWRWKLLGEQGGCDERESKQRKQGACHIISSATSN